MKTIISKIGDLTGVVVPEELLTELNLNIHDVVEARAEDGHLIIGPVGKREDAIGEFLEQGKTSSTTLDEDDKAWLNAAPKGKEIL